VFPIQKRLEILLVFHGLKGKERGRGGSHITLKGEQQICKIKNKLKKKNPKPSYPKIFLKIIFFWGEKLGF